MRTALMLVAVAVCAVSLVACGYAWAEVAGGVTDISRHWWSTAPMLGAIASMGALALLLRSYLVDAHASVVPKP